jgi:DNA-binding XRE family transcriptional regulator
MSKIEWTDDAGMQVMLKEVKSGSIELDQIGRFWKLSRGIKVRAEHKTSSGYLQLRKMVGGKRYHVCAHRVVWAIHNGPIAAGKVINHKNGQKSDNRPENLECTTYSENQSHAMQNGLRDQHGEKNPASVLTDKEVAEIRLAYANGGYTQKQLAKQYGVSHQAVSKIVRGDRRKKQMGKTADYTSRRTDNVVKSQSTGRFIGKKAAGHLLDGVEWRQVPEVKHA